MTYLNFRVMKMTYLDFRVMREDAGVGGAAAAAPAAAAAAAPVQAQPAKAPVSGKFKLMKMMNKKK